MDNSTLDQMNSSSYGCPWTVSASLTSILAVINTITLIGNMLIVTVFFKTPSLKTSTNYYIVNMAVCDLLRPFFSWPLYVSEGMLTRNVFISGSWALAACKLGMYFRAVSQIVSILSLVLIALDRFVAIVFPFKVSVMNGKIRVILLLVSWLIPLLGVLPYALFSKITTVENQRVCRFIASQEVNRILHAIGITIGYFIPLITIICLYSIIMIKLKQSTKNCNIQASQDNVERSQQSRKILKILITIVIAFFVCWTPLCIYVFLRTFFPAIFPREKCFLFTSFFFYVFPSLSTAINPVTLFLFSTNYKQALRTLSSEVFLLCKCRYKAIQPNKTMVVGRHDWKNYELRQTKIQ